MCLPTSLCTPPHGQFNRRWPWDLEAKKTCSLIIWTGDPVLPVPLEMSTHRMLFTTIQQTLSFTIPTHIHSGLTSLQHSMEILRHYIPASLWTSSLPWCLALLGNLILPDARINMPTTASHMRCNWPGPHCCCFARFNGSHETINHPWWFIVGRLHVSLLGWQH